MSLRELADAKIREAIEQGLFDDLSGKGRPLELEDLSSVPAELRPAYRMLKSAGCLPEEMELCRSMVRLSDLVAACDDDGELPALKEELSRTRLRFELLMERRRRRRH